MNIAKFSTPVLGEDTKELYIKLYGAAGERFFSILDTSPNEIAVVSKLIAYMKEKRGAE